MYFFEIAYIIELRKKRKRRNKMSFIEEIKQRAKKEIKTIVLPEAEDIRILEATEQVLKEQYANIVLVGNQEKIEKKAKEILKAPKLLTQ